MTFLISNGASPAFSSRTVPEYVLENQDFSSGATEGYVLSTGTGPSAEGFSRYMQSASSALDATLPPLISSTLSYAVPHSPSSQGIRYSSTITASERGPMQPGHSMLNMEDGSSHMALRVSTLSVRLANLTAFRSREHGTIYPKETFSLCAARPGSRVTG